MLIARDCLCEAQGCFLLYVLCFLITFSSLVPVVLSLRCQQTTFVTTGISLWAFISSWPTLPFPSFYGLLSTSGRGDEMVPSWTPYAILTHFTSSALDILPPNGTSFSDVLITPVYCLISLASYLLISHLTHPDSPISSQQFFLQNDLCWLLAHSALLITVLLLCCLHWTGQCSAEEWRAGPYFSPGKF